MVKTTQEKWGLEWNPHVARSQGRMSWARGMLIEQRGDHAHHLLHLLNEGQLRKFTGHQFQSTLLAWDHFCASEANAYFDLCSLVVLNLNRRFYLRNTVCIFTVQGWTRTAPRNSQWTSKSTHFPIIDLIEKSLLLIAVTLELQECSGDPQDTLLWRTQFSPTREVELLGDYMLLMK